MNTAEITPKIFQNTLEIVNLLSLPGNFRERIPEVLRVLSGHLKTKKGFFLEASEISGRPDQLVYNNLIEARSDGTAITHVVPEPLAQMMFSERILKSWLQDLAKIANPDFKPRTEATEVLIPAYICSRPEYPQAAEKVKRNRVCQTLMQTMQSQFDSFLSVPVAYDEQIKGFFIFSDSETSDWPLSQVNLVVAVANILAKLCLSGHVQNRKLLQENQLLKDSESKYRKLIKYSSEGIYYMKCGQPIPIDLSVEKQLERYYAHAYVEECNSALARMMGHEDKSTLLGQRIADLHAGGNYQLNKQFFLRLAQNNYRIKNSITQEQGVDGEQLYFRNEAFGVIKNDHLVGIWGIQRDITPLHQEDQIATTAKDILRAIPDNKMRIHEDGTILGIYGFSPDKTGLKPQQDRCKNKSLDEVLSVFIAQGLMFNVRKALETGKLQHFEFIDSEGESERVRYYEARINRVNSSEVIVILRNITKLKLAEKALTEQMHQVDQKNRQLQTYIESNLQLENFAYVASHDLREPVRTMRTFSQFLKRRNADLLDQESLSHLDFIIDGANRMNQLIEDLLTYSRVNAKTATDDSIELWPLLTEITTSLKVAIEETAAEITYQNLPDIIRGNRLKIQQLFQNLIANGIKFHRKGIAPKITVSAKVTKTHWQFAVADNGIGIEPEFHEQIFVIFKKLHNHQVYKGSGIGLTLVKRVVEQHGGDVWVESKIGQGTTFYFTLLK